MRKGFLGSLAALAAGAGLAFGQSFTPPPGPPGPPPGPPQVPPPPVMIGPGGGPPGPMGPADSGYYYSPDGNPLIMPPGLDGMIPPGSLGAGSPHGVYGTGSGIFNGNGPPRFWAGADYLFWTPKSLDVQYPLVTTSAPADLGVLGAATTASICGPNDDIGYDAINGFRAWVGFGVGDGGRTGIELSGFYLEHKAKTYAFPSNASGSPLLAVPFVDLQTGLQGAYVVALPGTSTGTITVATEFHAWGAEANCVLNLYRPGGDAGGLEFLVGARFLEIEEELQLDTTSTTFVMPAAINPSVFLPGTGGVFAGAPIAGGPLGTFMTTDSIRTFNQFWGAQVGFRGEKGLGKFSLGFTGKVAAGWMRQWVDLESFSSATAGGQIAVQPGGILNMAQDLCRHRKDRFAYVPEGQVQLACYITPRCRVHAGYTFMWVSSVLRPTSVTTPFVTPSLMPVSPTFTGNPPGSFPARDVVHDTDFFLHGFNVGFQISF